MPLKRTPPQTSLQITESDKILGSALAVDTGNETSNISSKQRPRKRQHDDELTVFMADIKKSITALSQQQDFMHESIKSIQTQNKDIKSSMEFISKQYDVMKDKLTKMEIERKTNLAYIQELEQKMDNMERMQKQASLEVRNIPIKEGETKQDLIELMKNVGDTINVCIEETQIRDVFRLSTKKENNQPIIVDFTTVILKEKILRSLKTYNQKQKDKKLNTGDLKIKGPSKPVFVSEMLTQSARRMYFLAREFSRDQGYKYCWTSHGKVFLRKVEGAPCHRILTEGDLKKLLPNRDN